MGTDNDRTMFKLGIVLVVAGVGVGAEVEVVFEFEPRRFSRERITSRNDMFNFLSDCSIVCVSCDPFRLLFCICVSLIRSILRIYAPLLARRNEGRASLSRVEPGRAAPNNIPVN